MIDDGSVPLSRAIMQDPHIMAMKMHWLNKQVSAREFVIYSFQDTYDSHEE